MRDLVLTVIVLGALPLCFARPYVGVLVWSWLGFMNPHRLAWGFAQTLPFSEYVAIATLLGLLFTRDRRAIPREREVWLLLALWIEFALSMPVALYPDLAWPDLKQVSKIFLMVFVALMVTQDRTRLRYLLLVTSLSIGFYGLKGGIWGLATGGANKVLGPDGSFIGDNNGLSLGLNMTLPLLFFLAREEQRRWVRWLLRATFVFSVVSVLLTYSRAGFLGLVVVGIALLMRTRWKYLAI